MNETHKTHTYLLRAERDPCNTRLRAELLRQVPRRAPDPAPHVQHLLGRLLRPGLHAPPLRHLVDEVVLGLDEVLAERPPLPLGLVVVPQVDVLTPVALQDAILLVRTGEPSVSCARSSCEGGMSRSTEGRLLLQVLLRIVDLPPPLSLRFTPCGFPPLICINYACT